MKKKEPSLAWVFIKWTFLSVLFPLVKFLILKVIIPLIKILYKGTLDFCKGFKEGFIKEYYKKPPEPQVVIKPKKLKSISFQEDLLNNYAKIID